MAVNLSATRPLIGITAVPRDIQTGYGPDRGDTAVKGMTSAVERAGGVPLLLPITEPGLAEAQLAALDGLVLSGGQDIDLPGSTNDERWIDPPRDLHEFALWRAARQVGLPILGICRGLQLANIMSGGTLIQMVDGHDAGARHASELHSVRVEPSSKLAAILGSDCVNVNTVHHQALDVLGDGIVASAWSGDGLTEAAEIDRGGWFVGVQWHPELMAGVPAGDALFEELVLRARGVT